MQIYFKVIIIPLQFLIGFLYSKTVLNKDNIFVFSRMFIMCCTVIISITLYLLVSVYNLLELLCGTKLMNILDQRIEQC